ncbi:MAG: hypothetical protein IJA53_08310 [Spirochaetaceae bacterium]|nr:hypothetical protein [Spirochaetaceae bacterium]
MRKSIFLFISFITMFFMSCNFFTSLSEDIEPKIEITNLSLSKTNLEVSVGNMDYVSVSIKPNGVQKDIILDWKYDETIIDCDSSSSWGFTFKAIKEGQTTLRCSYNGYEASCLITVSGYSDNYEATTEPYIYSNTSILQTGPGISEKVFVSLYGGDASDIDGYSWTVDNSSVVSIQPTGQYCVITAKEAGYARIKVSHNKATYPYYIGVYVFEDNTSVGYITTSNNIVTMNKADGEQNISVSLVNGKDTSSDSQFKWEIIKENDSSVPIGIAWNGNNAVITPKESGSCTIRITHPDAPYPLDILCRVITIVKNVFIKPDNTVVTLSGENTQTIKSTLENLESENINIDGFNYVLDDYNVAEIVSIIGDEVTLKGKANGSCKLIISHESAEYPREVLVIVNGQLADAIDASCYITTSQNYVRTKVGSAETVLKISLKGGEEGDEKDFTWNVKSTSKDGTNSDVISLSTTNGTAIHSRAAALTYAYGEAYINPICEGTAVISVSHPKIHYPTEILVKVLSETAILEEPLYFIGDGLVRVLNGASTEYTVQLKGTGKNDSDDNEIKWKCDNSNIKVSSNANIAEITAPPKGTGNTISYLTISHNKADADKKVMILTADTEEELANMKALYSDKLYFNIEVGEEAYCTTNSVGFDSDYNFASAIWTVKDSSICSIEKDSINPLSCRIIGEKAGATRVSVSITDNENKTYSCDYEITVYPSGTVQTEPEVYFTTSQNVINLNSAGKFSNVNVSAINLPYSEYSNIAWESEDESIAKVIGNGINATVTAMSEGETVINVSHEDSQNTLKIYIRVGSEYVVPEAKPIVHISSPDVITLLKDDNPQRLDAILVNYEEVDKRGFHFSIDNESIATISSQSENGVAYIKPVGSGQAQITIRHPMSSIDKKVLVVVGNSAEELAGFVYLTTNTNVVALGEGTTKSVSVSVKNAKDAVIEGYTWTSNNLNVVDITSSGANALLKGNGIGTAIVTVTNKECKYPLSIIVQVVDPILASQNPHIQLSSSVITVPVSSTYTSVTADLVGGTEEDFSQFLWKVNDSSICAVYGQNEVGKIRALSEGQTYVTVTHPKATYPAQLLVVCDKIEESECHISVPSSIISMKPNAAAQTITASLINGKETDKYSFSWSLDVYDVIDFQYSANVCTITPLQTGSATITISHPKAAYDQQVIVNVQEYSSFNFPQTNVTLSEGTTSFLTMQVPTTSVSTYVEYSVDNPNICSISGTKNVAQLTGVGAGTTTVRAKLIASSSGVEQASAEMLVYVKEAETSTTYITSSSTIYTVNKGKSQTLSATLTGNGVTNADQYNLKWTTSDSDVITITGINSDGTVSGQSIYITAKNPGEALITCSHEKAASDLQFYVVVPGSAEKVITFNKTYMTLVKGSSGTSLKANIENAESSNDYNELEWTVHSVGTSEVCRVMGSGQNVTIYPINVGEAEVMAQLPNSSSVAKCTVVVEAGKSFVLEASNISVQPFGTRKVKYTVSPANANLTWTMDQINDVFTYTDLGCDENGVGYVQIEGIKEGTGNLYCVTDGNAKGNLSIKVAWNYEFSLTGKTTFSISPAETAEVGFKVNPTYADITVNSTSDAFNYSILNNGDGTGKILITPTAETRNNITINVMATNPNNYDEVVGSKNITANFVYKTVTPKMFIVNKSGNFSYFQNNILYIGDGETVTLGVDVTEKNVDWTLKNIDITKIESVSNNTKATVSGSSTQFKVINSQDVILQKYYIPEFYEPYAVYGGQTLNLDQFYVAKNDVGFLDTTAYYYVAYKGSVQTGYETDSNGNTTSTPVYQTGVSCGEWGDSYTFIGRRRNPSKDGTWMNVSDYEKVVWYYRPATGKIEQWNGDTAYSAKPATQLANQPATKRVIEDKSIVSSVMTDKIVFYISHNGIEQRVEIPVYTVTRNCYCTQN